MNVLLRRSRSGGSLAPPGTAAAESYRRLRTMVDVGATEHPGVLLVTSPGAGDGTTTIVANLGVALSSLERPVLLIDGNLYRPHLHAVFGLPNDLGLSSVLSGRSSLSEVVQTVPDYPGVHVLAAGPPVHDPAGFLAAQGMERVMAMATRFAPVVFLDGPPLLPVAGGLVLAGLSTGVVVVARAGRTSQTDLSAAVELVEQKGTPLLGVILNGVRRKRSRWRPLRRDRSYGHQRRVPRDFALGEPVVTPRELGARDPGEREQTTETSAVPAKATP